MLYMKRPLVRLLFYFQMTGRTVKYGRIVFTLCSVCALFYVFNYTLVGNNILITVTDQQTEHELHTMTKPSREYFHVDEFKITDDILQLNGYFNNSSYNVSENVKETVKNEGISNLLNQIKLYALHDNKLERTEFKHEHLFKTRSKVSEVDCRAIFRGDINETDRALKFTSVYNKKNILPKEYMKLTKKCSDFILGREYITETLTEVESEFSIAYSLLMYKDVEQSERLLRAIYRPQHIYCIHVDGKSPAEIYDSMSAIAGCFDNVFMASKRINVQWGQMSVLEPELICMKELWNKSSNWKYFINLTGQEFPLRTNYELVRILQAYNGANDVRRTRKRANKDRWQNAGPPPHNVLPTKGSVHIVVNRGFVDYILHDQRAHDLLNWTRTTLIPDETFFSTLNHNPILGVPGAYNGLPEHDVAENIKPFVARFKNWGDDLSNWSCHGQRVHRICIFGLADLPLLATRHEMFANKFFLEYQPFVLDCLEELHFNRTRDEYLETLSFDVRWYSQLGFVSNKVD